MKTIILSILITWHCLAFSQTNFKYAFGFETSFDLLRPKTYGSDFEYFSSDYSNGYALNLGITSKLNFKKIFVRGSFAYNYASQEQTILFSNAMDLNISHTVRHAVPHCSFDYGLGRDFQLSNDKLLHAEIGFSTIFSMSVGPYQLQLFKSGTFMSTYSDEDEHWSGEMGSKEYVYEMQYDRPVFTTPYIKLGMQLPLGKNNLTFGLSAKMKRLVYENFIYLSSDTYSAIANSRSQSSSVGIFINYQFGKKKSND